MRGCRYDSFDVGRGIPLAELGRISTSTTRSTRTDAQVSKTRSHFSQDFGTTSLNLLNVEETDSRAFRVPSLHHHSSRTLQWLAWHRSRPTNEIHNAPPDRRPRPARPA